MVDRPRAAASGRSRPAAPVAPPSARHSTARVATTSAGVRRNDLPGWFWGALGCMTVLVIGLTVVFFMSQPGGLLAAPATSPAPAVVAPAAPVAAAPATAPARAGDAQPARGPGGIRIEPMAAPPPAVETAGKAAVAHPKAPPRSIKVARSPGPASKPAAAKPAAAGEPAADTDNQEEELLKPKPRAPAAAADDSDSDDK